MADLGITTGGDALGHVLHLGSNEGGSFTPDGIAAAVEKVHEQIRVISKEVFNAMPDVDDDFFNDWSRFVLAFTAWKTEHASWISRAWNVTRQELLDHVATYERLRQQWSPTEALPFEVRDAPKDTLSDLGASIGVALQHVAIGLGAVLLIAAVGYVGLRYVT